MSDPPGTPADGADQPPPLLGSWRHLYALVLGGLVLTLLLLVALARWAS